MTSGAPERGQRLTRRETETAIRMALGLTDKAIGRDLGISPRTVGVHASNVIRKLELETRAGVAAKLIGKNSLRKMVTKALQDHNGETKC